MAAMGAASEDGGLGVVRIKPLGAGGGGGERSSIHATSSAVTYSVPRAEIKIDGRDFTYPSHVIAPDMDQAALYDHFMPPRIQQFLDGVNVNVMAYGQTGSGKTHTMGSSCVAGEEMPASGEAAGLIPRAIGALFEKAGATEGLSMQATATFIEIYKEEVHDLLSWKENINPDGSGGLATLPIRENGPDGGLTLTGQQSKGVVSVDDCMGVLAEGARNRATGNQPTSPMRATARPTDRRADPHTRQTTNRPADQPTSQPPPSFFISL